MASQLIRLPVTTSKIIGAADRRAREIAWIVFGVLVLLLTLRLLEHAGVTRPITGTDGLYSHGYIIPVFSCGAVLGSP